MLELTNIEFDLKRAMELLQQAQSKGSSLLKKKREKAVSQTLYKKMHHEIELNNNTTFTHQNMQEQSQNNKRSAIIPVEELEAEVEQLAEQVIEDHDHHPILQISCSRRPFSSRRRRAGEIKLQAPAAATTIAAAAHKKSLSKRLLLTKMMDSGCIAKSLSKQKKLKRMGTFHSKSNHSNNKPNQLKFKLNNSVVVEPLNFYQQMRASANTEEEGGADILGKKGALEELEQEKASQSNGQLYIPTTIKISDDQPLEKGTPKHFLHTFWSFVKELGLYLERANLADLRTLGEQITAMPNHSMNTTESFNSFETWNLNLKDRNKSLKGEELIEITGNVPKI